MSFPQRARYKYTCQALLSQGDIYIITTLQIMQQNTTEEASYAIKKKNNCLLHITAALVFSRLFVLQSKQRIGTQRTSYSRRRAMVQCFDKIKTNPITKPQERIFTPLGRSTGPSAISAFPKPFEELKRMTSSVNNETHT